MRRCARSSRPTSSSSRTATLRPTRSAGVGEDIPWREVVGVVGDVYDDGIDQPVPTIVCRASMLRSFWLEPVRVSRDTGFIVRTERARTRSFLDEAHAAIWAVRPDLPVYPVQTA